MAEMIRDRPHFFAPQPGKARGRHGRAPHRVRALPRWLQAARQHFSLCLLTALWLVAGTATGHAADPALIAVDIGHTVEAPGALSARGRTELSFNRELAGKVDEALTRLQLGVRLVNSDGHIGSLRARTEAAADADFLISIHHDSVNERELRDWTYQGRTERYSDAWSGHSLFVSRRNPDLIHSLLCASAIGARLQRAGFVPTTKNARRHAYADAGHAVHFYDNLVVLHSARQSAVLFEAGVIRHREEELLLRDPARQARMAGEIATGVAACMQVRHLPAPYTPAAPPTHGLGDGR